LHALYQLQPQTLLLRRCFCSRKWLRRLKWWLGLGLCGQQLLHLMLRHLPTKISLQLGQHVLQLLLRCDLHPARLEWS
jgi:hypothetical protein